MLSRIKLPEAIRSAVMVFYARVGSIEEESGRDVCVCLCGDALPDFRPDLLANVPGEIEVVMRSFANDVCKKGMVPGEIQVLKSGDQIVGGIEVIDIVRHVCYLN